MIELSECCETGCAPRVLQSSRWQTRLALELSQSSTHVVETLSLERRSINPRAGYGGRATIDTSLQSVSPPSAGSRGSPDAPAVFCTASARRQAHLGMAQLWVGSKWGAEAPRNSCDMFTQWPGRIRASQHLEHVERWAPQDLTCSICSNLGSGGASQHAEHFATFWSMGPKVFKMLAPPAIGGSCPTR